MTDIEKYLRAKLVAEGLNIQEVFFTTGEAVTDNPLKLSRRICVVADDGNRYVYGFSQSLLTTKNFPFDDVVAGLRKAGVPSGMNGRCFA